MSNVTFVTRTQIGEKVYEEGQVAALTARLEVYVLERKLAVPGGSLPDPDVVEVDFPKPPPEEEEELAPGGTDDGTGGEGTGAPPGGSTASSPATGSQPQPAQASARKSAAKKTRGG